MAHVRMPRVRATAWVSKPTTPVAPDPTRGGYSNSRAGPWHEDTPPRRPRRGLVTPVRQAKGVKTGSTHDRSPVKCHRSRPPPPPVPATPRAKGPETKRPNRSLRSGTHPDALVQRPKKSQKTTCFTLILLTRLSPGGLKAAGSVRSSGPREAGGATASAEIAGAASHKQSTAEKAGRDFMGGRGGFTRRAIPFRSGGDGRGIRHSCPKHRRRTSGKSMRGRACGESAGHPSKSIPAHRAQPLTEGGFPSLPQVPSPPSSPDFQHPAPVV